MLRKFLLTASAVLAICGIAWAANNIQIVGPGGRVFTMRTTDNAGVHSPWVVPSTSGGTEIFTAGNPGYVSGIGVADNTAFASQTNSIIAGYAETTPSALTTGRTGMVGLVPVTRAVRVRLTNATGDQAGDPCQFGTKVFKTISQTTSTELFTGTASNRTYVCHVFIMANAAESISLVSGTGSVCGTSVGPLVGGTTALSAISANGGYSLGSGGFAIAKTDTDADNVCLLQAGSVQLTGVLSYVVAP